MKTQEQVQERFNKLESRKENVVKRIKELKELKDSNAPKPLWREELEHLYEVSENIDKELTVLYWVLGK